MSKRQISAEEAMLVKYFQENGYPDCHFDNTVIKVERFQNALHLQMALYANCQQLRFSVYYDRAPGIASVCKTCIDSMGNPPDVFTTITPTEHISDGKYGLYVNVDTKWKWRNITEDDLKGICMAYSEFRAVFEPCFAGVSHIGEGRQVQFKDLKGETAERARSLYHSNRELVDLVMSCKPLFSEKYELNTANNQYEDSLQRFQKEEKRILELLQDYLGVNVFKVLKMGEHEIRHSNMLGWLLDARESHGKGTEFIGKLVGKLKDVVEKDADDIHFEKGVKARLDGNLDLMDFIVYREDDNEDIKLRSYANRLIIVIENKWNADAGENQLKKYADRVEAEIKRENEGLGDGEKRWKAVFAYLTLTGERTEESKDDKRWIALSYRSIKAYLKNYLAHLDDGKLSSADALITQYYRVLEMKPELMGANDDRLVGLCKKCYGENALAFELMFQSDTLYFNNSISDILKNLSSPGKAIVTSYAVASGVAKLRLAELDAALKLNTAPDKQFDKFPYYVELELHNEKQDRACCNLKRSSTEGKKEKTIQWYDKCVDAGRKAKAKKRRNWKSFVYDGTSDSLENAVRDAISELVDLVKKDPDYFRDQLIGNRANGQDDD